MRAQWSPRVYELKKIFMPYWKPKIGIPDDAPQEAKDAYATMENGLLHIVFDEPQRAVCRGQSVVIYDDDTVLGGGIIC